MALSFSTDSSWHYCNPCDNISVNDVTTEVASFEIDRCVAWINNHNFKKVALQFPDDLLYISDEITLSINRLLNDASVYVLADTSYGSCCVDEVAAEHVISDALIHFGPACLTPCARLPILYIFGKRFVDCDHVTSEFSNYFVDKFLGIFFVYDVVYSHAASKIYDILKEQYCNLVLSELVVPEGDDAPLESSTWFKFCGRQFRLPDGAHFSIDDYTIFYIGLEGPTLTNLLMSLNQCKFVVYDPEHRALRKENVTANRALQKRYYLIERARDARLVGILVGTLGIRGYLDVINRMKSLAKLAGKKSYTIVVGRINPAKLANFPEIDVFILIACAENSLLDSKEFFRPIVTPFEFEIACNEARQWTGNYVTDFTQLMPGAKNYVPFDEDSKRKEIWTSMSLITGKMNQLSSFPDVDEDGSVGCLLQTDSTVSTIHNNASGNFLMQRSWRGLEQNLGKDEASTVQQGQSGIASGYKNEGQ